LHFSSDTGLAGEVVSSLRKPPSSQVLELELELERALAMLSQDLSSFEKRKHRQTSASRR
jgi:hypothetical protein